MKIERAYTIVTCPGRNFVTLKIVTGDGVYGVGDATLNGRELAVKAYLDEHVIPCLIGRDSRTMDFNSRTERRYAGSFRTIPASVAGRLTWRLFLSEKSSVAILVIGIFIADAKNGGTCRCEPMPSTARTTWWPDFSTISFTAIACVM